MMFDMLLTERLHAAQIVDAYDAWTALWHSEKKMSESQDGFDGAVQGLHRANFELWHEEDRARDPRGGDAAVAAAKRTIDSVNQQRNDQIERMDRLLLQELAPMHLPNPHAELHSETPGQMLDRLSILSLKRYHTLEEMERAAAPTGHRERNRQRLAILDTQRTALAGCLDRLWQRVLDGSLRFQLYPQLKMYNDPDLNPVLYAPEDR